MTAEAPITGKQTRAARRLLIWAGVTLATRASVNPSMLVRFETGGPASDEELHAIRHTLEIAGVEFLPGDEVRLCKPARLRP